jgi:hypothetical protein
MIPSFPICKNIELSDKEEVESFTRGYAPYSDFNFVSLYSWDTKREMGLSQLNGNLVIRFTDYVTGLPFYSYIGTNKLNETAHILLEQSGADGFGPKLELVPEVVAAQLDRTRFVVLENPDHTDYVLAVERLAMYEGSRFVNQRNHVRRFLKEHPDARFETLDIGDPDTQFAMRDVYLFWLHNKKGSTETLLDDQEYLAFARCIDGFTAHLLAEGIYEGGKLVGFWLLEDVGGGTMVSHFEKADTSNFHGITSFLKQKTAQLLIDRDFAHINMEQGLGIPGLQASKESYYPAHYLKKYTVTRL